MRGVWMLFSAERSASSSSGWMKAGWGDGVDVWTDHVGIQGEHGDVEGLNVVVVRGHVKGMRDGVGVEAKRR
jgi:hypothetical protein